jgi:hypothetical protein
VGLAGKLVYVDLLQPHHFGLSRRIASGATRRSLNRNPERKQQRV